MAIRNFKDANEYYVGIDYIREDAEWYSPILRIYSIKGRGKPIMSLVQFPIPADEFHEHAKEFYNEMSDKSLVVDPQSYTVFDENGDSIEEHVAS